MPKEKNEQTEAWLDVLGWNWCFSKSGTLEWGRKLVQRLHLQVLPSAKRHR